jgi:biotin operon repressor
VNAFFKQLVIKLLELQRHDKPAEVTQEFLARALGKATRTIKAHTNAIRDLGFFHVEKRCGKGRHIPNRYHLNHECKLWTVTNHPQWCDLEWREKLVRTLNARIKKHIYRGIAKAKSPCDCIPTNSHTVKEPNRVTVQSHGDTNSHTVPGDCTVTKAFSNSGTVQNTRLSYMNEEEFIPDVAPARASSREQQHPLVSCEQPQAADSIYPQDVVDESFSIKPVTPQDELEIFMALLDKEIQ